jgi:tetratricopeptide (TPR) repeat protein
MKRLSALVLDNFRADTRFLMSDYLYNPLEWFSQRHPGLEAHLWKTAGPPDGPRGLDFPLRVVSISRFPTREHIAGDGLRLGDLFISDQVFESTEDLGAFLLDFSFQAFADANSLSKHAQQQNFLTLATLWNVDTAPFLDKGPRTRDDYVEAMDLTVEAQTPLREKDWERARNLLMQAYEHDPYSKHTLGGLAHIAQSTENYEEAIGCWTEVNRILPSFQADWNLALLYHEIGRHVEALEAIRRAARYPLVYERFYTIYAQILESAGRSEDVDALELERSLREEFI